MGVIKDYIKSQDSSDQQTCLKLHHLILKEVPQAIEAIKYGMPTYVYHENMIHFAVFKNHLGLYPTPNAIKAFEPRLKEYKYSKGAIQFPKDSVPFELVREIVLYRKKEIEKKHQ